MKYLIGFIFLLIFSLPVFAEPYVYSPNIGYNISRVNPNYQYNVNIIPIQPYKVYYYPGYQLYYFHSYESAYTPSYIPGYISSYVSPYQSFYTTPNYYQLFIVPIQTPYGIFYFRK